jgi:hypothetical protein
LFPFASLWAVVILLSFFTMLAKILFFHLVTLSPCAPVREAPDLQLTVAAQIASGRRASKGEEVLPKSATASAYDS